MTGGEQRIYLYAGKIANCFTCAIRYTWKVHNTVCNHLLSDFLGFDKQTLTRFPHCTSYD